MKKLVKLVKTKLKKIIITFLTIVLVVGQIGYLPKTTKAADSPEPPSPEEVKAQITDKSGSYQGDAPQQGFSPSSQTNLPVPVNLFQTDLFTGRATANIPISLPPARGNINPALALSYSSGSGYGWLGMGWNLGLGSIQYDTKNGVPSYGDGPYIISMQNIFGNLKGSGNNYKLELDPDSLKITKEGNSWKAIDKNDTQYYFGQSSYSQISDPQNSSRIFAWYLDRIQDVNGNYLEARYQKFGNQVYLEEIKYTGNVNTGKLPKYGVRFSLTDIPKSQTNYRSGFGITTNKKLESIVVVYMADGYTGAYLRNYTLGYSADSSTEKLLLKTINSRGYDPTTGDWVGPFIDLPPITFEYGAAGSKDWNRDTRWDPFENFLSWEDAWFPLYIDRGVRFGDVNADGRLDMVQSLRYQSKPECNPPGVGNCQRYDINNVWLNTGNGWQLDSGRTSSLATISLPFIKMDTATTMGSAQPRDGGTRLIDVNGDGYVDIVNSYYASNNDQFTTSAYINNKTNGWTYQANWNLPVALTNFRDPNHPRGDQGVRFADINGDGRVDLLQRIPAGSTGGPIGGSYSWPEQNRVWINSGSGWSAGSNWSGQIPCYLSRGNGGAGDYGAELVDLNGDGLIDVIQNSATFRNAWINNGRDGWILDTDWNLPSGVGVDNGLTFGDLNGDGLIDALQLYGSTKKVFINTGGRGSSQIWKEDADWASKIPSGLEAAYSAATETVDLNNDNKADFIRGFADYPYFGGFSIKAAWTSAASPSTNLLTKIDNGIGGITEINYQNYGPFTFPYADFPMTIPTVSSIATSTPGGSYQTSYSYVGGKYDREDKEFRGFADTRVDVSGSNSRSIINFHQDDIYKGKVYYEALWNLAGSSYSIKTTNWTNTPLGGGLYRLQISSQKTKFSDDGTNLKETEVGYQYDGYNNPIKVISWGDKSISGDEKTVYTEYLYNADANILNKPKRTWTRKDQGEDTGPKVAESWFYYDGNESYAAPAPSSRNKQIKRTQSRQFITKGRLTKQESWLEGGQNPITRIEYDPDYGLPIKTTDANNNSTTTEYDSVIHQYPVKTTNTLDQFATSTYDYARGLVTSVTDANGQTSRTEYDALGRPTKEFRPTDTDQPSAQYEYHLTDGTPRTVKSVRHPDGRWLTSYTYYDGLGREIGSRSPGRETQNAPADLPPAEAPTVGVWTFDSIAGNEVIDDSSHPTYNNATINGATLTPGPRGQAMRFNSAEGDYLEVTNDETLDLASNFSFELWVNPTTPASTYYYQALITKQPSGTASDSYAGNYELRIRNNKPEFFYQKSPGPDHAEYTASGTVSAGQWTHLVVTLDGTKVRFYLNGSLDSEFDQIGTPVTNDKSILIGKRRDGYYFDGSLDQIKIYTWALGSENIASSYGAKTVEHTISGRKTFDAKGRVKEQYSPYYVPDNTPDNTLPSIPNEALSAKTVTDYDWMDRVTQVKVAPGTADEIVTQTQYDGWTTTQIDPNGNKSRFYYDAYQQLKQVEELKPDGSVYATTSYQYDALGNLTQVRDYKGNTTTINYDTLGRKTSMSDPDMGAWTYQYDPNGNLIGQTDAKNQTVTMAYDALNRLEQKTTPEGKVTKNHYDSYPTGFSGQYVIGRLTATEDPTNTTVFWFDQLGREVKNQKIVDGQSYTIEKSYDILDRLTKVIQPDQDEIYYDYYDSGAIKSIRGKDAKTYVNEITYKANGQREKIKYGNNSFTRYEYNPYNFRLTRLQSSNASQQKVQDLSYSFDKIGNITRIDDAVNSNRSQTFGYDHLNRLTSANGAYGNVSYQYDEVGNLTKKNGNIEYKYGSNLDGTGVQPHAVRQKISNGQTTSYQYDANGNMSKRGTENLTYDSENHLISHQPEERSSTTVSLSKGWNFFSLPYAPDDNHISSVLSSLNLGQDYLQVSRYNAETKKYENYVGNPDYNQFDTLEYGQGYAIYISNENGVNLILSGRKNSEDSNQNLKQGWNLVGSDSSENEPVSEFLSQLDPNNGALLAYFDNQSASWKIYPQDFQNLEPGKGYAVYLGADATRQITAESKPTQFTYDGEGGRLKKQVGDTTNLYLGLSYEKEIKGSQETVTKHIFDGSNRIVSVKNGSASWYHSDHLGSSNVMTDQNGQEAERVNYYPYGETFEQTGSDLTNYLYTGKELDESTGLYHYGTRYYDASLGRFIQADTIVPNPADPQSLNRYAYARNNPMIYTDPSGHFFIESFMFTFFTGLMWGIAATVVTSAILGTPPATLEQLAQGSLLSATGLTILGATTMNTLGNLQKLYNATQDPRGFIMDTALDSWISGMATSSSNLDEKTGGVSRTASDELDSRGIRSSFSEKTQFSSGIEGLLAYEPTIGKQTDVPILSNQPSPVLKNAQHLPYLTQGTKYGEFEPREISAWDFWGSNNPSNKQVQIDMTDAAKIITGNKALRIIKYSQYKNNLVVIYGLGPKTALYRAVWQWGGGEIDIDFEAKTGNVIENHWRLLRNVDSLSISDFLR